MVTSRAKTLAFLLTIGLVSQAFANDKKAKLDLEAQVEARILNITKGFDELAIVFASVKYAKTSRPLPATPFVIQDNQLNKDFGTKVSGVDVTIYSKLQPVPDSLTKLVEDAVSDLGVKPAITFRALPENFGKNLITTPLGNGPNGEGPKININLDEIREVISLQGTKLQWIVLSVGAVAATIFLMAIFVIMSLNRNRKIIEVGLSKLSASVEESGGSGNNVIDMPQMEQARSTQQALPSGSSDTFKNFSQESIVAMLSDCYWGQYDTFAAYIWKRIPVEKRSDILKGSSYLEEYVHFLSGMDEQNLGFEQDPYYLNPLPLYHLDNNALTEAVRKNPGLIAKIPNMRVDSLSLEVKERLQFLSSQGRFAEFSMPDFQKMSASTPRVLKKHIKFVINSVEEEEEILALEGLDPFVCRDIPTLGFLVNANEGKVKELLESFSAQELAQAWIGPASVLETLSSLMPEKKFKLVEAYLEKIRPSRQSRPFQVLHFRANDICFSEKKVEDAPAEQMAS